MPEAGIMQTPQSLISAQARPYAPLRGTSVAFLVLVDHESETSYISHILNPGPNMKRTAAPEPPKPDHTEPGRREVQGRRSFSWPQRPRPTRRAAGFVSVESVRIKPVQGAPAAVPHASGKSRRQRPARTRESGGTSDQHCMRSLVCTLSSTAEAEQHPVLPTVHCFVGCCSIPDARVRLLTSRPPLRCADGIVDGAWAVRVPCCRQSRWRKAPWQQGCFLAGTKSPGKSLSANAKPAESWA